MAQPPVDAQISLGHHLLTVGSYDRAVEQFRAVLSGDPDHAGAHALMALALVNLDRLPAAEHEAKLALQLDPVEPFYFYVLAVVQAQALRWEEAKKSVERAIEWDPEEAPYHSLHSHILRSLNRLPEAEQAARRALELDSSDEQAHLQLAHVLHDSSRHSESRQAFEHALTANPEDSESHNGLGIHYLSQNDPRRALEHFEEALRLDPTNRAARENLVLAMGARNWFYGLFWRWSLFLSRFSRRGQIAVVIGFWLLMRVNAALADAYPAYAPAGGVLLIAYLTFCVYSWVADPLFRWYLSRRRRL